MASWIWILIIVGIVLLIGGNRYRARMPSRHHGIRNDGLPGPLEDGDSPRALSRAVMALVPDSQHDLIDAISSIYRGDVFFFCSTEDRDAFEATQGASLGQCVPSGRSAGA